jgi:hypothetical protein
MLASLAIAGLGAFVAASQPPPGKPVRVPVLAYLNASLEVEPLLILGNRTLLVLENANATLSAPVRAVGVLEAWPVARGADIGRTRYRVYMDVLGFHLPVPGAQERDGRLVLNLSRVFEYAEEAAEQAGLGRPAVVDLYVEAVLDLSVRNGSTVRPLRLEPRLLVEKKGPLLAVVPEPASAVVIFKPRRVDDGARAKGVALLAAGAVGLVASAVFYAYTRPRPPVPPGRVVDAALPQGLPVVEVASPEAVASLAERLDLPVLRDGERVCVLDRGVAYCHRLRLAAEEAAERGGDEASTAD